LFTAFKQLYDLARQGFTADLLKDILTIFYTPLAQVYRAANIADSLSDLQSFIADLIRTVESVEDRESPVSSSYHFVTSCQLVKMT